MNKLFISAGLALAVVFSACKKEDLGPAPSNLDATTLTHEAEEGAVVLKWNVPDNASYKYIEVKYMHPDTKKEHTRLASIHATSIRIDNLLKRYGAIEYKLTPVGEGGARGTTHTYAAECLAVPTTYQVVENSATELRLTADDNNMWTDSHQDGDGTGLPALIDNVHTTYWHIKWSPATTFPHYLVVKLPEAVSSMSFYWKGRNNANRNNPTKIKVYAGNEPFTGAMHNQDRGLFQQYITKLKEIKEVSGMPTAQAAEYTSSPMIFTGEKYQYVCFEILEGNNSTSWSALAEWKVFKHQIQTYNPETGEKQTL